VKDDEPIAPHLPVLGLLWILLNNSLRRNTGLGAIWIRFSYIPLCISAVLVCLWVLEKLERFGGLRKALRFFGERSLELYLTHVLIRNVFYHYIPVKTWDPWGIATYAAILLISLVISTLLHPVINKLCGALVARKETV
jgi:peptidoglycan/LPS O-acetylase OafA/YrhL